MREIVTTKVKCPKCRSSNLRIGEVWIGHSIEWDVVDGKFDRQEGNLEPGDPDHLVISCKSCDHRWRVRGACQIHDIIEEYK